MEFRVKIKENEYFWGGPVGCGTDIAIESADVVLMRDDIRDVATAIRLGRATLMNVRENLAWAFVYNLIGIPMAMGLFGLSLDPMFGALAMSLSSLTVVMNALRLYLWRPVSRKTAKSGDRESVGIPIDEKTNESVEEGEDAPTHVICDVGEDSSGIITTADGESDEPAPCEENENNESENIRMTKVIKVDGMMCHHCEAHVKRAVMKIDGVIDAVPSHKDGTLVLTLLESADIAAIVKAVEEQGYSASV